MPYNFDEEIPLLDTHSAKYDKASVTGAKGDDVIPMWVADMDFRACPAVTDALQAEIDRGVMGYYAGDDSLRAAICDWMRTQHGWAVAPEWLYFTHGVVAGLGVVLEAFTKPADGVILFTPVYHAFARTIKAKGRAVVESVMPVEDGQYVMDLEALAASLTGSETMVVFCSPHNPGGKLWSASEITALAEFCVARDLILVSDEIHMDLVFPGKKHLNTAVTAPEARSHLVTLSAASKGFNIAGGETSFVAIEDAELRRKYAAAHGAFAGSNNRFGLLMMEAAFRDGADWLDEVCSYIEGNVRLFEQGVNAIPGLAVMKMDSTYLAWVDFAGTGMDREEFSRRVLVDARLAVNDGPSFGSGGESWLRFNLATRRALVEEAVARLAEAFADLQ